MLSNFSLGLSLKKVLDMINAMQIIVLLPLIETDIPANAHMFFVRLTNIAGFDFFEIDGIVSDLLKLPPTDPINERFEASRIETQYFINNLGTFYLIFMLYFIMCFFWLLIKLARCRYKRKCLKRLDRRLYRKLFWNGTYVTIREFT